ncbi:MAG: abortive infection family protein [bacterium]|nr:abortive infection family protein [bacterium]
MPLNDQRRRNALILAIKRAMEDQFSESDWRELGYLTNTNDYISNHPRLLRSLRWEDPDYGGRVLDAIEVILNRDPANLHVLLGFAGIEEWIKKHEPEVHAEFYPGSIPAIDAVSDVERSAAEFDIDDHIRRIRVSLETDPALAIGSTKELIESVLKTILGLHGAIKAEDMPKLLKQAQATLGIDPRDVNESELGGEPLRRLLGGIGQIIISVTELRNLYGTGHGKSMAPGLDPGSTRLVVGAGTAVAAYLMERYKAIKGI